mgnify:CR=1 FL=1
MTTLTSIAFLTALLCGPPDLPPEEFARLHALIRPQPGEFAWYEEIPWLTSVQDALEKAAAEGKPVLVWCSADGQPCGAT